MGATKLSTVYQVVTDRILDLLEQGTVPWRRPWSAVGAPRNLVTGREYRGFNVFMLAGQGYGSPFWATYKQIAERGGHVRKGERATPVVFWGWVKEEKRADGTVKATKRAIPFVRYYNVFNLEQTDGLQAPVVERAVVDHTPIESAELVVAGMPKRPAIQIDGDRAAYSPAGDYVLMPARESFESADAYYQVLFHELTHSTAHPSRLARKSMTEWAAFGSESYSQEELVAEMGAAFLMAHCELTTPTRVEQSAAYIQSWLKALRNDPMMVVHAAQQAQKAADYIAALEAERVEAPVVEMARAA